MKNNKIAFIICTNDKDYMTECMFYISQLKVPDDMELEIIRIEDAVSMTSGYNRAMRQSDAKYKVYLHQDVFILNENFIYDIIKCFEMDAELGMLGIAGSRKVPNDARVWDSLDIGGCYSVGTFGGIGYAAVKPEINNPSGFYEETEFIDGMLIATSKDIEWDERIDGFHYYDLTQCIRFREAGYKVAVVRQEDLWCFHDFGPLNLETYDKYRKIFCYLYPGYDYLEESDNINVFRLCEQIVKVLAPMIQSRRYEEIKTILQDVDNAIYFNQKLLDYYFLMELHDLGVYMEERDMLLLRHALIRTWAGKDTIDHIINNIDTGEWPVQAVIAMSIHSIPMRGCELLEVIRNSLFDKGVMDKDKWDESMRTVEQYETDHLPLATFE